MSRLRIALAQSAIYKYDMIEIAFLKWFFISFYTSFKLMMLLDLISRTKCHLTKLIIFHFFLFVIFGVFTTIVGFGETIDSFQLMPLPAPSYWSHLLTELNKKPRPD